MDANRMFTKDRTDRELIFTLRDPSVLYQTGYLVLEDQAARGFVPCVKTLFEGQVRLLYDISAYRTLAELLPELTPPAFRAVAQALLRMIGVLRDIGFLRSEHVYHTAENIFIEPDTLTPCLLYLPLAGGVEKDCLPLLEKKFKDLIIHTANTQPNVVDVGTIELLKAIHASGMGTPPETVNAAPENESGTAGDSPALRVEEPRLIPILLGEDPAFPLELPITKDDFMIGRSRDQADGVVLLSIRISRLHCRILHKDGAYCIVDMQSVNGTSLNGARLTPHQETPLRPGDKITLADVPLVFMLMPEGGQPHG